MSPTFFFWGGGRTSLANIPGINTDDGGGGNASNDNVDSVLPMLTNELLFPPSPSVFHMNLGLAGSPDEII